MSPFAEELHQLFRKWLEAYLDGSYPYGKLLYLVAPATPSAEAKAFVDFLAGPAAHSRLRDLGLVAGAR